MKKNSKYMMDIVPGVVIAVFSLLYLSQVPGIQAFEGLGSTPWITTLSLTCGAGCSCSWGCGWWAAAS